MSIAVFNINSPNDISWGSFLSGNLEGFLQSEVAWNPSLTFQEILDQMNGTGELGNTGFDSILVYREPNYVPADLGDLVPEGAILLIYISSILQTPNTIGDLIVTSLNGFASLLTGCPCNNVGDIGDCTTTLRRGLWALITREIPVSLGGANSFLAPCFNPGSSVQVSSGAAPFFSVTAQVMRIRNFDRVKFLKVSSGFKECTQTMVINIIGQTCGFGNTDNTVDTRFGIDVSVQATALGQNLFPDPKFCDALQATVKNQDCPVAQSCVQVFLPATIIEMTLEVALVPGDPITCATGSSLKLDWSKTSLNLNFNFTDKPDFWYPGLIINEDFRVQLESAMLQLTNGVMRNTIDKIIADKLSPFVNQFVKELSSFTNFSFCVEFPTPSRVKCTSEPPILPEQCDLCDDCCLCLTRGDCGELCRQECPCVVPFCVALNRTIDPIWWLIVAIIGVLLTILTFFIASSIRGIGR